MIHTSKKIFADDDDSSSSESEYVDIDEFEYDETAMRFSHFNLFESSFSLWALTFHTPLI